MARRPPSDQRPFCTEATDDVPKFVRDRLIRIESKLTNHIKALSEEQALNAAARVRLTHMERELNTTREMVGELLMAFKQFKREWDAEADYDPPTYDGLHVVVHGDDKASSLGE